MEKSSYITGFVDGEGSFLVSFSRRPQLKVGIEVRPSFNVGQHARSESILHELQRYFGCGSVRFDRHDQTYKYEVRSLADLIGRIIPHFERVPLQTSKKNDFGSLVRICRLMAAGEHHKKEGVIKIIHLAYQMNNLGARRYAKEVLLMEMDKVKV